MWDLLIENSFSMNEYVVCITKLVCPQESPIDDWIRANGRPSWPMRFNFLKPQNILAHFGEGTDKNSKWRWQLIQDFAWTKSSYVLTGFKKIWAYLPCKNNCVTGEINKHRFNFMYICTPHDLTHAWQYICATPPEFYSSNEHQLL